MGFAELVAAADRAAQAMLGGEPVTYAPESVGLPVQLGAPLGVQPVTITGMFDSQFVLAEGDAHAGVEAAGPAVFFRVEDLPADPETDNPTITIRGVDYSVTFRKPDGMGGIVLGLRTIV